MAYDAIVAGARGLFFFGGQFKQVMNAADRASGWNWSYWQNVERPLLVELTDADHAPALTGPIAALTIKANASDVALSVREAGGFLYLIAVNKSPSLTSRVRFSGLPAGISEGLVLAHPENNPARPISVAGGVFTDPSPFAPHNARVYRSHSPPSCSIRGISSRHIVGSRRCIAECPTQVTKHPPQQRPHDHLRHQQWQTRPHIQHLALPTARRPTNPDPIRLLTFRVPASESDEDSAHAK
jgi:hypothetical protein